MNTALIFAPHPIRRTWTGTETDCLRTILMTQPGLEAVEIVSRYRKATDDFDHTIAAIYTEVGDLKRVFPNLPVTKTLLAQFSHLRKQEEAHYQSQSVPERLVRATVIPQAPTPTAPVSPLRMQMVGGAEEAPEGYMTGAEVDEYLAEFPAEQRSRHPLSPVTALRSNGSRTIVYANANVEAVEIKLRETPEVQATEAQAEAVMNRVRAVFTALDQGVLTADEAMVKIRAFTA